MANEISITSKISATKSSVTVGNAASTKTQNMRTTLSAMAHNTPTLTTTRAAASVGSVDITNATGDEYFILVWNRDPTNYIIVEQLVAAATYYLSGLIRPGESWGPNRVQKIDASGYGAYYLKSSASTIEAEVIVIAAGDPAL